MSSHLRSGSPTLNRPADSSIFSLNGATLLRFVRGFASGAGLEYDVAMINRALCARHDLHIIQIHMARSGDALEPTEIQVGRGRVTSIPLLREVFPPNSPEPTSRSLAAMAAGCKRSFRDHLLFNPVTGPWFTRRAAARRPVARIGDVPGVGEAVRKVLQANPVDLLLVHAAGGSDAWEAIHAARSAGLPAAMQLHFANERFKDYSVRLQVANVDGVGGVSDVRVPSYLAGRFTNLLTAVDLQFFSRAQAGRLTRQFTRPVLILPARIVPNKGHEDVVTAVAMLHHWGIDVDVIFAGRADQPEFEQALRRRIAGTGSSDSFHFLGLLNQEQLRDLYPACQVLAFPTYHQEGLPRILLEAQAMEVPVVVYDSGGSRAGLQAGKTGFLVRPGDVAGFADAIRQLLVAPALAASFAQAGRRFVETFFGLDALADRHERFIADTMRNAQTRRD